MTYSKEKFKMTSQRTIPKVQAATAGGATGVLAAQLVTFLLTYIDITLTADVEMAITTLAAAGLAYLFGRLKRPNGSEQVVVDNG